MEYITTFNSIFFQALALTFVMIAVQLLFIEKIWSLSVSFPKIAGCLYTFIAVAPSVYFFYTSVVGTTTAMFWVTVVYVATFKVTLPHLNKFHERSINALIKAIEVKRGA